MADFETQLSEQVALCGEILSKLRQSESELKRGQFDVLEDLMKSLKAFCSKLDGSEIDLKAMARHKEVDRVEGKGSSSDLFTQAETMMNEILQLSQSNESLIKNYVQSLLRQMDDVQKGRTLIKALKDCTRGLPKLIDSHT